MNSAKFTLIMNKLEEIEQKIKEPPGHFWILILLLLIAHKIGAC